MIDDRFWSFQLISICSSAIGLFASTFFDDARVYIMTGVALGLTITALVTLGVWLLALYKEYKKTKKRKRKIRYGNIGRY